MPSLVHPVKRYSPMAYEPEGQDLISGGDIGDFQTMELMKALGRYLPKEQGVCARTLALSRAYLWAIVKSAFTPLASKHGRGLPRAFLASQAVETLTCIQRCQMDTSIKWEGLYKKLQDTT